MYEYIFSIRTRFYLIISTIKRIIRYYVNWNSFILIEVVHFFIRIYFLPEDNNCLLIINLQHKRLHRFYRVSSKANWMLLRQILETPIIGLFYRMRNSVTQNNHWNVKNNNNEISFVTCNNIYIPLLMNYKLQSMTRFWIAI